MDWVAAKSYYLGFHQLERFPSIVFFYSYSLTWSIAVFFSLILPILFVFAPSSLRTTRTSYFLIICLVCLANLCCIYIHPYMLSDQGEPNLSYHSCRFAIYISTFAKPIGLYLTFLFSIERLVTKVLANYFASFSRYRLLCQRLFALFIFLGTTFILFIRLYEVLKLTSRNQGIVSISDETDAIETIDDRTANSTDRNVYFKYCFNTTMNIDNYAQFLSFYTLQYWFEYVLISLIIIIVLIFIVHQCFLLPRQRQNSFLRFSINTKFYFSLSLCLIATELFLLFLHCIVDDVENDFTDTQLVFLEVLFFVFNFRCILFPFIICITMCDPLKEFLFEMFITRPYLDNVDENDTMNTRDNQTDLLSSTQQAIRQKFRRPVSKNQSRNDHDYFNDESQPDL